MKNTVLTVVILMAVGGAACKKSSTAPTQTPTTTTSTSTTPTTSTTTTSIAAQTSFTVTGRVTDSKTGDLLKFADIEIIQGTNLGRRFQGDGNGNYSMPNLTAGAFIMRVWAAGYLIKDVLVTIIASDVRSDVTLDLAPITTSTTVPPGVHANFTWSPSTCTIDVGPVINCTVDGGSSSGSNIKYHWAYAGKDVFDQVVFGLSLGCGNLLGTGVNVTASVRLTVTDDAGNSDTIDQGVPFMKLNGVCP